MKINITGRKLTLKDDFKERVEIKLSKFDRVFGEDAEAYVTVTLEKKRNIVEVTIKQRNGMIYRAEKIAEDKNDALDEVIYVLGRQIRKNKAKLDKRIHSGAILDVFTEHEEDQEPEYKLVKNKSFPIKPMSIDEAILQMNMVGHQFYMFRNCDTNEINVVYRRKDGNYGVIEPEL